MLCNELLTFLYYEPIVRQWGVDSFLIVIKILEVIKYY